MSVVVMSVYVGFFCLIDDAVKDWNYATILRGEKGRQSLQVVDEVRLMDRGWMFGGSNQ